MQISLFERNEELHPAPAAPPARKLRPYQLDAFQGGRMGDRIYPGIRKCLAEYRSTAVILATGCGKTTIAGQAALEAAGRVLFLAHLDTLVSQAREELQLITGQPWEQDQGRDFWADRTGKLNVVASVQTIMRPGRLASWPVDAFSLIIVDEAHHYVASAFKRPLDHFAAAKILALTATPDRSDRKALGRYVQSVAYKMDLVDGINEGWLVPVVCKPPITLDVTLDDVKTVNGELVESQIEEKIKGVIGPVVKAAEQECRGAPTLIFTPRVESAHAAAQALNAIAPSSAHAVDGSMPRDQKRSIIRAFKRREFPYLANCGVLVEGFDDRGAMFLLDAAPTKSRARCVQKLGRLLRPVANVDACSSAEERKAAIAASSKPQAIWIDLKFNGSKHDLACPLNVLGGTFTDKERARAKKILEKKGGDPLAALQEARRRIAQRSEKAKVKLALGQYDPTTGKPVKAPASNEVTPGQRRELVRLGIPQDVGTTRDEISKVIGYERMAARRGWCLWAQRTWLAKNIGVTGRGLPVDAGRRLAEAWKANGKLRLTKSQIDRALGRPDAGADG